MIDAMNRRQFVAGAAAAGGSILGANDRVLVGLVGCGGRGRYVARFMKEAPNVEFTAVCDVYETNRNSAREWAGPNARAYADFRKMLEQRDLDAVLVSTTEHWHAYVAVSAIEAGKDVYVEKPLAHNVREGRAIVTAARKYNRIAQAGTQHRSAPHFPEVAEIIQSGKLGEVRFVRVWNYSNMFPNGIGRHPDSEPPAGLDWDMYCGPAPLRPFNRSRFLGSFRWFWDYAGGTITDFGTHRFDTVHQIMGVDKPKTVSASGGRFSLKDAGEMPDVIQATFEYPGFIMSYEASSINGRGIGGQTPGMRYYNARGKEDQPHGMAFYGTNGTIVAERIGYEIFPEPWGGPFNRSAQTGERIERKQLNVADATGIHAKNFIESVRSRKPPIADIEAGHRATLIGHLGNIAYKVGRKLTWDAEKEEFAGDPEANKMLARAPRAPWKL